VIHSDLNAQILVCGFCGAMEELTRLEVMHPASADGAKAEHGRKSRQLREIPSGAGVRRILRRDGKTGLRDAKVVLRVAALMLCGSVMGQALPDAPVPQRDKAHPVSINFGFAERFRQSFGATSARDATFSGGIEYRLPVPGNPLRIAFMYGIGTSGTRSEAVSITYKAFQMGRLR
jgi:hypothetical protein